PYRVWPAPTRREPRSAAAASFRWHHGPPGGTCLERSIHQARRTARSDGRRRRPGGVGAGRRARGGHGAAAEGTPEAFRGALDVRPDADRRTVPDGETDRLLRHRPGRSGRLADAEG